MFLEWLYEKTTVAEAEAKHTDADDPRGKQSPQLLKPFGFLNSRWEALKAQMVEGDELWLFRSPSETWRNMAGCAGVALVRDGKIVAKIVTSMN
jgi:hypothetical protein